MLEVQTQELIPVSEEMLLSALDERDLSCDGIFRANERAKLAHGEQIRDNGAPYLDQHIYPVAFEAMRYCVDFRDEPPEESAETVELALLHDSVEDSNYTLAECLTDFGPRTAERVWRMSKIPGEIILYKDKLLTGDETVRTLKGIDRLKNLQSSLDMLPKRPDKLQRKLRSTAEVYIPLLRTVTDTRYAEELEAIVEKGWQRLGEIEVADTQASSAAA